VTLSGWAVQRSTPTSTVALAFNVGSSWIGFNADLPGATAAETAYPGAGTNHGFQTHLALRPGSYRVCLWASGPSGPVQLECVTAVVPAALPPAGDITDVVPDAGGVTLSGWAVQRSAPTSTVALAVNVGTSWIGFNADLPGAAAAETAYPGAGTNHGFTVRVALPPGSHRVCLWATGPAGPAQLECVTAVVPAVPPPAGSITSLTGVSGGFQIAGWVVLPSSLATPVHLAVNIGSVWVPFDANQSGSTAAEAAYPGAGTDHGFSGFVSAPRGLQSFCLWAVGVSGPAKVECRTVTVP
jgi:hypothetical protein